MDVNILKRKNLVSIYLVYKEKFKKQIKVDIHFLDKDVCYFETDLLDNNMKKPQKNIDIDILAYSVNGVYIGKSKLIDTTVTLQKVIYILSIPKKWEYTQTRASIRKKVALPFTIKYNDGYEIKGETIDISLGGISFRSFEPILPIYHRFNANIDIKLGGEDVDSNIDETIQSEVKYLRDVSSEKSTTYIYRFLDMDSHNANILKLFINAK